MALPIIATVIGLALKSGIKKIRKNLFLSPLRAYRYKESKKQITDNKNLGKKFKSTIF